MIKIRSFFKHMFLLITLLLYGSCNEIDKDEVNEIFNSQTKILFFEQDTKDEIDINKVDVVIFNLETNKSIFLLRNIFSRYTTKLSQSGRYMASFYDNFPHNGKFKIYDFKLNENRVIELKGLEGLIGPIGITEFDFFDDSTIVFSAINSFYIFGIQDQEIKLLKNTGNQYIDMFIVNSKGKEIAFSYYVDYKTFDKQYLALFDIPHDSINLLEYSVFNFGNWDQNNDRFIFSSEPKVFHFFNADFSTKKLDFDLDKKINKVLFFSEDTLLINVSDTEQNKTDLFLYNTVNKKIVKQLTSSQSIKYNILVFNKLKR